MICGFGYTKILQEDNDVKKDDVQIQNNDNSFTTS